VAPESVPLAALTRTHWKTPPCHGAHPKQSFTGGESLARRGRSQVQERFSHGGNTRWCYGHPDMTDARHDGDVQIGPHRLEQRCKLIRIE
jgi:hypothetical protein